MMGVCLLVSGLMLYPIPVIRRWQGAKVSKTEVALGKLPSAHSAVTEEEVTLRSMDA